MSGVASGSVMTVLQDSTLGSELPPPQPARRTTTTKVAAASFMRRLPAHGARGGDAGLAGPAPGLGVAPATAGKEDDNHQGRRRQLHATASSARRTSAV